MKALWAVASAVGVSRGEADRGEEEVEDIGEVDVNREAGEGKPELPGVSGG